MGLFDTLKDTLGMGKPKASQAYIDLLSKSLGIMRLRQAAFTDLIAGLEFALDFSAGTISFGGVPYPISFVGVESKSNESWMWGSNNLSNLSEEVIRDVTAFKSSPIARETAELQGDSHSMDNWVHGHNLAAILAVSVGNCCYYRCSYNGGAAFILVKNVPERVFAPASPQSIITIINGLITALPLNHRLVAESLLEANCTYFDRAGDQLIGYFANNEGTLTISFDEKERISGMTRTVSPSALTPSKE